MSVVLLAVEQPFKAALLRATLEEHGHEVVWPSNLKRTLHLATNQRFDVVLVDMSSSSQASALNELVLEKLDRTPLIVITDERSRRLPPTVDYVVNKPFAAPQLLDAMRLAAEIHARKRRVQV